MTSPDSTTRHHLRDRHALAEPRRPATKEVDRQPAGIGAPRMTACSPPPQQCSPGRQEPFDRPRTVLGDPFFCTATRSRTALGDILAFPSGQQSEFRGTLWSGRNAVSGGGQPLIVEDAVRVRGTASLYGNERVQVSRGSWFYWRKSGTFPPVLGLTPCSPPVVVQRRRHVVCSLALRSR